MGSIDEADLQLAFELGSLAGEVALPIFRAGAVASRKPDGSVVTNGDLEVERQLLAVLARERPEDAVLSEESGAIGAAARRWILDPIDGTTYFASHRESWGTHVALEVAGEVVLGLITRPVRGEWFWAVKGGGAYRAPIGARTPSERLRVSKTHDATRARVMAWAHKESALAAALRERNLWVEPTLDALLDLACGRIDAVVDHLSFPWDLAPAVPLIEEAGGRFVDHDGGRRLDNAGGWFDNGKLSAALRVLDPR